jgi:threonylcarbamoyladenosine tRNA methylthiotransferase MtaB
MLMNVYLKALGCRLNEAELERWAHEFNTHGFQVTNDINVADLAVINTCAVTAEAVRKSRQIIRRIRRAKPRAKLVVSGCYVSLPNSSQIDLEEVDLIVSNQNKVSLVDIVTRELDVKSMPDRATQIDAATLFARGRNRAFIKIQDGCRYRCTFCIVTVARGSERSRLIDDIVAEINQLVTYGVKEAVLTGVHIGRYGSDTGSNLYDLIDAILTHTDLARLRLASVEPWDLPVKFFELFRNTRLMPHLHLPLQSGSDTVLRRMARRCRTGDFKQLVTRARDQVTNLNITTDIIVGFPGETEREWRECMEFIEKMELAHIHIFSYSPRLGTKAAHLPNQISKQLKKQRSKALQRLSRKLTREMLERNLGKCVSVLWESKDGNCAEGVARYCGYTPNYLKVKLRNPKDNNLVNEIRETRLIGVSTQGDVLLGELV